MTESCLLIGSRSGGSGHPKKDEIGEGVALAVVIEEEKKFFTDDRTAEVSSELVEVIGRLLAAVDFVDWVVGIQASIAEEFKGRAVKCVATGFGLHISPLPGNSQSRHRAAKSKPLTTVVRATRDMTEQNLLFQDTIRSAVERDFDLWLGVPSRK